MASQRALRTFRAMNLPSWLGLLSLLGLLGCSFERVLINEHLLDSDLSQLVVGETTIEQALDHLGPPSVTNESQLFDNFLVYPRHLRYVVADRRVNKLRILPTWIMGLGHSEDEQPHKELLLLFDEAGLLTSAWLGGRRSVFPMATAQEYRNKDVVRPLGLRAGQGHSVTTPPTLHGRLFLGALLLAALLLSGCHTASLGLPVPAHDALIPPLTGLADTFAAFGLPTRLSYDEQGHRTLIYEYDQSKGYALGLGMTLIAFNLAHRHRGFDRLEVVLDEHDQVVTAFVVIVNDGYERRLNPWWDGADG